ncbi:hypothetical protein [Lactobacillus helveticus]|uniref:Uncharacterized protein n=1 Tax=Lactobacillus helveticus TaxID=1587 RepID=A0A6A7K2Z8_LACHE|nr:hypothetical protein [Lactobacillus helveticus]MPW14624.1 hypothetical protein [Lactobacillus helveticus]
MNYKESVKLIEKLVERKCHYVDFVPFTFPDRNYAELDDYLETHYKETYAKKIIFIAFSLMYYYDCHVYLDEEMSESFSNFKKKDLRNIGLDILDAFIHKLVVENRSGLNIIITHADNTHSLMRIKDGYQTLFFNINGECLNIIKQLVDHQGLFLKKNNISR